MYSGYLKTGLDNFTAIINFPAAESETFLLIRSVKMTGICLISSQNIC